MEGKNEQGIWHWQSNKNPWDKKEKEEWTQYSELENYMLESAFTQKSNFVELENSVISLKHFVQIDKAIVVKQSPIKRIFKGKETKKATKEIFYLPTKKPKPELNYENLVFIYEWCQKNHVMFELKEDGLIDPKTLNEESNTFFSSLMQGILFELVILNLEKLAMKTNEKLKEILDTDPKTIVKPLVTNWLSIPKFYNLLNDAVFRHESIKVDTLGPYAYLVHLFIMNGSVKTSPYFYGDTVYKGLNLNDEQLEFFKEVYSRNEYFSWCSFFLYNKDISSAKKNGNTLFLVDIDENLGGVDMAKFTGISPQGEIMLPPNSYFKIESIEKKESKNWFYLKRVI